MRRWNSRICAANSEMMLQKQKEEKLLEKRFLELSRTAYEQNRVTYSDFLNLNALNILHSLPKQSLYTDYTTFGGYDQAERQMAAFLPDALSLRDKNLLFEKEISVLRISPLNQKYAEELTHRDHLGAILNLGIERCKTGDILIDGADALLFLCSPLKQFVTDGLTRVRHTSVIVKEEKSSDIFTYTPRFEEIKGTVASVRLDSLLSLAFSSSRSRLSALITGGSVFVNGRLITSNAYAVKENDMISVRGMGRFRYCESLAVTKKNRIYVLLHKYI